MYGIIFVPEKAYWGGGLVFSMRTSKGTGLTSYRTVTSFAGVYREVLTHIVFFQQQGKQQQEFLSDPFRQIRQQVSNHLPPNRRRIR